MTSLSLYRPEDEALLGLLDAYEGTQPGSLERAAADSAIARYLSSQPARDRVDLVISVWSGLEAQINGIELQQMTLRQKRGRIEEAIDKIKRQTAAAMASLGVKRTAGTAQSLVLHTNPEAVNFTDEALVPDEFKFLHVKLSMTQWADLQDLAATTGNDHLLDGVITDTPAISKSAIKTVIKGGGGVPGAFMDAGVSVIRR